jgi:hypothetical protein
MNLVNTFINEARGINVYLVGGLTGKFSPEFPKPKIVK